MGIICLLLPSAFTYFFLSLTRSRSVFLTAYRQPSTFTHTSNCINKNVSFAYRVHFWFMCSIRVECALCCSSTSLCYTLHLFIYCALLSTGWPRKSSIHSTYRSSEKRWIPIFISRCFSLSHRMQNWNLQRDQSQQQPQYHTFIPRLNLVVSNTKIIIIKEVMIHPAESKIYCCQTICKRMRLSAWQLAAVHRMVRIFIQIIIVNNSSNNNYSRCLDCRELFSFFLSLYIFLLV